MIDSSMRSPINSVLKKAEIYLKEVVAPQAMEIDRDSNALKIALQGMGDRIHLSAPMELSAMNSTNTVNAKINGWLLEGDRVVTIKPAGSIQQQDKKNVLDRGFFALGCAKAGLDILETAYQRKKLSFLKRAFDILNLEWNCCYQALFAALSLFCHSPKSIKKK
jgi:hypothetical protein